MNQTVGGENLYRTFCQNHGIDFKEVEETIDRVRTALPEASINVDDLKYADYGVLRLTFEKRGASMLPMLFGTVSSLSKLAQALWAESAKTWTNELGDLTQRGTYLKRRVLLPAILDAVDCHYHNGDIVDVGCGDGVLFRELVKGYDNVYGFDFVKAFIDALSGEYPHLKDRLRTANILEDQFTHTYDVVIASALLLTMTDVDRGLKRLFELVSPEGTLIIGDVCAHFHRSLGYYDGSRFILVHDPNRIAHFEKDVGGGKTTAIHNHHPSGYYRQVLESFGAICSRDEELQASRERILEDPLIPPETRETVVKRLATDLQLPTFSLLVVTKPG